MTNKLLIQQFKTIIHSLLPDELSQLFGLLKRFSKQQIKKSSSSVGYKCWQTLIEFEQIRAAGFGRDENEATLTCIRNFTDVMLEQEERFSDYVCVLKAALKELRNPSNEEKVNESNFWSGMNQSFEDNVNIE
jgi:hypothetical protein